VAVPAPQIRGLSMSFGGRIEGVPVRDFIGKSEGFRRPGYAISVETGVLYTRGRGTLWIRMPIPAEGHPPPRRPGTAGGPAGDAAFADNLLMIGYSRRF